MVFPIPSLETDTLHSFLVRAYSTEIALIFINNIGGHDLFPIIVF
jgi:hypothetical protein